MNPIFSIFTPVYNSEKYLSKCLESILNQSLKEFELILYDDGSSDNSYIICEKYANFDLRIKLLRGQNGTSVDALNNFIINAKGEFIAFVDNDDWIDSNYLEIMYKSILEQKVDCAVSSYRLVNERDEILSWYTPNLKHLEVLLTPEICKRFLTSLEMEGFRWNKVFRKSFFIEKKITFINKFPADIRTEYEMLSNVSSCVLINNKGYYYRQSSTSEVSIINKNNLMGMLDTFYEISEKAKKQGLVEEAEYYFTWRSVNILFNHLKQKKKYQSGEWKVLRKKYSWNKWINKSLFSTIKILNKYENLRDGRVKFGIKAAIVRFYF